MASKRQIQNSQGQDPANPTPSGTPPPPSPKRQRLEGTLDVPNPNTANQPGPELNRPPTADRLADVIEGNLCKPANHARIQKVGLRNIATMAQSKAVRTAFLAHGLGHGIDMLEKENFYLKQKLKTLGNAENIIKELTQKVSKLEVDVGRVTTLSEEVEAQKSRVKDLETENKTLTKEKTALSSTISLLKEEKEKVQVDFDAAKNAWQLEEKELKTDFALYHGYGFNKTVEQVEFLYPDLDISQVGMFKEIINGALVEPE
ncbi:disease resistance protein RML1A-like [Sesbania bispinosa]|nr:disease resistance protein RML1A-like [Sesbania bispinosa]